MRRALASALLVAGCHAPLTEIVVRVESNIAVPSHVDHFRLEVDATAIGGVLQLREAELESDASWPLTVSLIHDGGPLGPIEVRAIGLLGAREILRNVAAATFVPRRSIDLALPLLEGCNGGPPCPAGQACIEDACQDLPPPVIDAGSTQLGDAGSCPSGCDCLPQVCAAGACSCDRGCTCLLSCPIATECAPEGCRGAGTQCVVSAERALRLTARCEDGASCVIDARAVDRADVECRSGASCDVDCTDALRCSLRCINVETQCRLRCSAGTDCVLEDCATPVACLDGSIVCNRSCPG